MTQQIIDALAKLDVNNDNHWTADGLPRLDTIKALAENPGITRDMVTLAMPGFNRYSPTKPAQPAVQQQVVASPVSPSWPSVAQETPALLPEPVIEQVQTVVTEAVAQAEQLMVDVVQSTSEVIDQVLDSLENQIAKQIKLVDQAREAKDKAIIEFEQQRRKLDTLIEQRPRVDNHKDNAQAIQDYLESQRRTLMERAERMRMIKESGVNLKELTANLRAPIDAAMSRKNSRGAQRPGG